jgi:hypothetical protein
MPAEQTVQQLRQLIEGICAVPVQVDIKVVPVQDEKGSIEKMDAPTARRWSSSRW